MAFLLRRLLLGLLVPYLWRRWRQRPSTGGGAVATLRDEPSVKDERISTRAELLPEERAAGSDDPEAQAAAILEDSEQRTMTRDAAP